MSGQGPTRSDPARLETVGTGSVLAAIAEVFEATLSGDPWPRIMMALAPLVGSPKAMFVCVDRIHPSESVTLTHGIAPEFDTALKKRNLDDDRLWRTVLPEPAGTVFRA